MGAPVAAVSASGREAPAADLSIWIGASLVPVMLLEMMLPIASTTSLKLALAFLGLSLVAGGGIRVSLAFAAHLAAFAAFVLLGVQPNGFFDDGIVRTDVLNGLAALTVAPFVAWQVRDAGTLGTFIRRSAVLMVIGGMVGAVLGAAKLYYLTQGVLFDVVFSADGSYPLGTSLGADYNIYAFGLVCGIVSAMWLRVSGRAGRVGGIVLAACVVVMAAATALTGSRRGMLFLLVALLLPMAPHIAFGVRRAFRVPLVAVLTLGAVGYGLVLFATRGDEITVEIAGRPVDLSFADRVTQQSSGAALVSTRAPLIAFAWQRVDGEYTSGELLRGRGFSFLADMGRQFAAPDGTEYPHNFVLSALLHGGVPFALGLLALVGYGALVAYRGRAGLGPYPIVAGLALIFALTSSASLYSTEVLVFLLVLVPLLPVLRDQPTDRVSPA
jgi:hypothetical protein